MIRSLLLLTTLCILHPPILGAQEAYLGIQAGRNAAQLSGDRTRSEPMLGIFSQVDLSQHVGVGWGLNWFRAAANDSGDRTSPTEPHVAEPEYLTTDIVGRLSWNRGELGSSHLVVGATAFGGGWLGVRSGGRFIARPPRRTDFGHLWGVSLYARQGPMKLEVSVRAYHGERDIWEGGSKQRGSPALIGIAYRIR